MFIRLPYRGALGQENFTYVGIPKLRKESYSLLASNDINTCMHVYEAVRLPGVEIPLPCEGPQARARTLAALTWEATGDAA